MKKAFYTILALTLSLLLASAALAVPEGGADAHAAAEITAFPFEGATLTFMGWHEDTSIFAVDPAKPTGRYVMVRLFVTEGEAPWARVNDDPLDFELVTSAGTYSWATAVARGLRIGDGGTMAVGSIDLAFDLPKGEIPEKFTFLLDGEPVEITLGEAMEM